MGDLLRKAHELAVGPCDEVRGANRSVAHDRLGRGERGGCSGHAVPLHLHAGDIRLLSGLEEVVAAMRRGADELERWGRCAEVDRIDKVRRLATLVGGLNQLLGAEVVMAVTALADIEASRADHQCIGSR